VALEDGTLPPKHAAVDSSHVDVLQVQVFGLVK